MNLHEWLAARLGPERIVAVDAPIAGIRATRCRVRTDRRDLIAKWFTGADEFARREIASYERLADHSPTCIAPVVVLDAERRAIALEALPHTDLFAALVSQPYQQVMNALGDAIAELVIVTAPMDLLEGTARRERDELLARLPAIERRLMQFDVTLDDGDRAAMRACCDIPLLAPVALTQGDPAPSNVLFTVDGARLVDFEYGAPRHALFDLAQWFIRCPLPASHFGTLSNRVRERLVEARVFGSTGEFDAALERSCAHAGLYMTSWLPVEPALDGDLPWGSRNWTVRSALMCTANRVVDGLPSHPLAGPFERLRASLRQRWPEVGSGEIDWTPVHSRRS